MTEKFLTTDEVLSALHVNLRTVYRWVKAGHLPAIKVGRQWRFRQSDLEAWLERQQTGPTEPAAAGPDPRFSIEPRAGASPYRILVADDEAAVRDLLARSLSIAEYEVDTVTDGRSALDRLQHERFDLLLTDLRMPGLDGLALIREVRRLQPDLPIVVATGYSTETTAVEALNLGVIGYLRKPFRITHLLGMVARALHDEA